MSILGIIFLWFLNVLSSLFSRDLDSFNLDQLNDYVEGASTLYNIFAWVDQFVPVDVLLFLAGMTTLFYAYKFVMVIIRFILPFFKK